MSLPDPSAPKRPRAVLRRLNVDPTTGLDGRGCWWGGGSPVFAIMILPLLPGAPYDAWTIRAPSGSDAVSAVREIYPNVEFVSERRVASGAVDLAAARAVREAMRQDMRRGGTPGGKATKRLGGKITSHAGRSLDVVVIDRRRRAR